jgi:hypothetical protein
MRNQLFATLAFAGALAAWSITAKAETSADFVFKNESHRTVVEFYIAPHGQKFGGNWLLSPLLDGQSAHLHFFDITPGPRYDVAVVYGNRSNSTWPMIDVAELSELRVYVGDSGDPAMEMTSKDSTDRPSWF